MPTIQGLNSSNIWIGNMGATKHFNKYKQGGINPRLSSSRTREIYGQAVKPAMLEVDILGFYCNKTSKEQFVVKLHCVDVIPESHYNLMSITKLMEEGHRMTVHRRDGITLEKNGRVIKFDMRVETPKGVLWCAYIKRNDTNDELAAGLSNERMNSEPIRKDVKTLEPFLKCTSVGHMQYWVMQMKKQP